MEQLTFKTEINTTAENVWYVLWNDYNYRQWTSAFCEGSYAIGNWNEGGRIHFLDPKGRGMYSDIKTLIPNQQMSFAHIGNIVDNKEQAIDAETQDWSGCTENYYLTSNGDSTTLTVVLDALDQFKDFFNNHFPNALANVKNIAENPSIRIETLVNAPINRAWDTWTLPAHIVGWNAASPDWHCPKAENDLREGGEFTFTMAAKDGSFSFDFGGIYDEVRLHQSIKYHLGDGRKVAVTFSQEGDKVKIVEIFDAENIHPFAMQEMGWQSILNNYTQYTENQR